MKSSGKSVRPDAYKGEEDCWLEAAPAIHASIPCMVFLRSLDDARRALGWRDVRFDLPAMLDRPAEKSPTPFTNVDEESSGSASYADRRLERKFT
jgi:hypothetical protein